MALSVDEPPSEALIEEMHSVGFGDAIFIELALRARHWMSWPEPVERVAVFLRASGAESRLEEFTSAAASAQGAAEAIGCDLDQIVKSLVFICDERPVLALVPGDRRADPAKVGDAARRSGRARRAAAGGRRRDGRVAGRRRAVPAAGRGADPHRADAALAHGRLGRGRLRPPHGDGVARRARAPDEGSTVDIVQE